MLALGHRSNVMINQAQGSQMHGTQRCLALGGMSLLLSLLRQTYVGA